MAQKWRTPKTLNKFQLSFLYLLWSRPEGINNVWTNKREEKNQELIKDMNADVVDWSKTTALRPQHGATRPAFNVLHHLVALRAYWTGNTKKRKRDIKPVQCTVRASPNGALFSYIFHLFHGHVTSNLWPWNVKNKRKVTASRLTFLIRPQINALACKSLCGLILRNVSQAVNFCPIHWPATTKDINPAMNNKDRSYALAHLARKSKEWRQPGSGQGATRITFSYFILLDQLQKDTKDNVGPVNIK